MLATIVAGTPNQHAAAAAHLARQAEWRHVHLGGTRYIVVPSGRSDKVYWLDLSNERCSCLWNQRTQTLCSHLLAAFQAERVATRPASRYATLVGACEATGCDNDREAGELFCERHALCDAF